MMYIFLISVHLFRKTPSVENKSMKHPPFPFLLSFPNKDMHAHMDLEKFKTRKLCVIKLRESYL